MKKLLDIVAQLRGPQGCSWDKEQTHSTLAKYALEESGELADALIKGNTQNIKEELGDVLLQVVLNAQIAVESETFTFNDVVETLCEKLVRRHPHVFDNKGGSQMSPSEVHAQWKEIKAAEKTQTATSASNFGDLHVSSQSSALLTAHKIGELSKDLAFDWSHYDEVFEKVEEELAELKMATLADDLAHTAEEVGDLLFSIAQLARHLQVDSETALRSANLKFADRFTSMMKLVQKQGKDWKSLSDQEKNSAWEAIKVSQV